MSELSEQFQERGFTKSKVSAVYAIYSRDGDCLYVGETKNFYSRLDDHYHSSRSSSIRGNIQSDEDIDISVDSLWEQTKIKTMTGVSDDSERKELEGELIEDLDPKYNRN
jgi:GIY-YIG catalytic domain.